MGRYEVLAEQIKTQIRQKIWRPGERIPSIRQCCKTANLSPMTVLQAYQLLESQGWIYARPKSGYFVAQQTLALPEPAHQPVKLQSTQVDINDLLFDVLQNTKDSSLTQLGSAFPDPQLFPWQALTRSLASSSRKMSPFSAISNLPPGNEPLRQIIAQRYAQQGLHIAPDEIVITSGGMESLNLSLQAVTQPGDLVAIESPTFYGALQAIERLRLKAVEIPTHPRTGVDLEVLAQSLQQLPIKACWFMTSFQNPLGFCMSQQDKRQLVSLLELYQVPLIEDDVYGELYFGHEPPLPAKTYDSHSRVLHCSSFSKCLSPGFRVGWVAAGEHAEKVQRLQLMSTLSASIPTQLALNDYLRGGGFDAHLRRLRRTLEQRQHQMLQAIQYYLPETVKVTQPTGGYFLWLELAKERDSFALYQQLLAANVAIAPGILFSSQKQYTHHMRINYAQPWNSRVEQAMALLGQLLGKPPVF
jgi:Transcriptional regulators containing a DNA-binding HTH domain and an aminotransferase domain (MocR family) and their eukaryotic orthologs